jgi:hypothetical protein
MDTEFLPGVGIDVGTANIVVSRRDKDGNFVNMTHRNMLYELDGNDESAELLKRGGYLYAEFDNKYFVIGKDALDLVNALGTGEVVRPMKDGLLNPELKKSQELLFHIIYAILGDPIVENEPVRFSVPANPVDDSTMNNLFHQMVLQQYLTGVGYAAEPLNEAMGIIYDQNPVLKSEDEGDVPLTGWSVSMGGGMMNIAGSFKGLAICEFSVTKCGDYIDQSAAKIAGLPVSRITKLKETKLDLDKVDMSDRALFALSVYYDEVITRAVRYMGRELAKTNRSIEGQCEIVVAGGTSLIPGVVNKFKVCIEKEELPFEVYNVRNADEPFYSVAQGMCLRAASDYSKSTS